MRTLEAMTMTGAIALVAKAVFLLPIVKVSLALAVLAIGLRSSEGDAVWLIRRPGLLARSFLSINVIVPLVALAITQALDLQPAIEVAIVALSISPLPPILPNRTGRAGGESAYSIGLLTLVSAAAIVVVPISVSVLAALLGASVHFSVWPVAVLMAESVLLPLGAGALIRHFAPKFAARAAKPVNAIGLVVLAAGFLLILLGSWPSIRGLLDSKALLATVIVTALGLLVGHELGGPIDADRPVLALASVVRHPAVAIAVAHSAFPNSKLVAPAVLLQFVVAALAATPYVRLLKRMGAQPRHAAPQQLRAPANGAVRSASERLARPTRNGRLR
jgi:bile acid:Na+ symporter, BASS family